MTTLQPEVENLFRDVLTFLNELKESSSSKAFGSKAGQLIERIERVCPPAPVFDDGQDIYDEAEAETPAAPELPNRPAQLPSPGIPISSSSATVSSKGSIQRRFSSHSSYRSDEAEIAIVSAASFDLPTKKGSLEKKRPDTKVFSKTYQKRFCVISEGIFYYFDSPTAKKQNGAFYLSEYEARPAYHLVKNSAKREGSFELVAPGKRSYQFLASSFEEMKDWIVSVTEWSDVDHPPISSLTKPSDAAGTAKVIPHSGSDSGSTLTVEEAPDYVDSDLSSAMTNSPLPHKRGKPPPVPQEQEVYDEAAAGDGEIYDEGEADAAAGQDVYDDAGEEVFPAPPQPGEIYDELAPELQEEQVYDEADVAPPPPRITKEARPLPPPPPEPEKAKVITVYNDDYSNMYYGQWDCEASEGHELSFSSGEIIHVIDREHEGEGWWTALLDGKVGLVPKSYLIPAYAAC